MQNGWVVAFEQGTCYNDGILADGGKPNGGADSGESKPAPCAGGKAFRAGRGAVARGRRGTGIPAAQRRTHGDELQQGMVHACEEQLGFALLERRIGGAGGGGASLTEKGRALLARYRAFDRQAHEMLDQMAQEYFTDLLGQE